MAQEFKVLQCAICKNSVVSIKFKGRYYCSHCFQDFYDEENNEIKLLPAFVPAIKTKSISKNAWRISPEKETKKKLLDILPEEIEF